jgi:hypothetical protein
VIIPNDSIEQIKAYYVGLRTGLRQYAWWKDGVQYVGTCGRTLQDAIGDTLANEAAELAKFDTHRERDEKEAACAEALK